MFDSTPFEFEGKKYIRISDNSGECQGCAAAWHGGIAAELCAFANRSGQPACGEYGVEWHLRQICDDSMIPPTAHAPLFSSH